MNVLHVEKPDTAQGKGRIFEAMLIGYLDAPVLFEAARGAQTERPVWAVFAGSDTQMRPFTANLQMGRRAVVPKRAAGSLTDGTKFEFLRSAGYEWRHQRIDNGGCVTVFLPELFRLDPGMVDPEHIQYLAAPTQAWIDALRPTLPPLESVREHMKRFRKGGKGLPGNTPTAEVLADLLPWAMLFAAYLDRRTGAPLIPDPLFQLRLFVYCLAKGYARFPRRKDEYGGDAAFGQAAKGEFEAYGLDRAGLVSPVLVNMKHKKFDELYALAVETWFAAEAS